MQYVGEIVVDFNCWLASRFNPEQVTNNAMGKDIFTNSNVGSTGKGQTSLQLYYDDA